MYYLLGLLFIIVLLVYINGNVGRFAINFLKALFVFITGGIFHTYIFDNTESIWSWLFLVCFSFIGLHYLTNKKLFD
ncbi:MAG: hypothetical protein H7A25_05225 [Leptospiraceae bacterium]|nr:hypothetical protein [Leptospiraceae bacterium]